MTDVLKIPEAAKALGCTEACARAMAASRRIPAQKVGRDTVEQAAAAYREASLELHGEFSILARNQSQSGHSDRVSPYSDAPPPKGRVTRSIRVEGAITFHRGKR